MAKKISRQVLVRDVIRGAVARNHMKNHLELCPYLNVSEQTMRRLVNGETEMTLKRLWSLDGILKFTDEEWLALRCK